MKKFNRIISLGLVLGLSLNCFSGINEKVSAKVKTESDVYMLKDDFGKWNVGEETSPTMVYPTYVPVRHVETEEPVETEDPFDMRVYDDEEDEEEEEILELPKRKFIFKRPNVNYTTYYDRMQWEKKHLKTNLPKYDAKHGAVKEITPKWKYKTIKYKPGMKSITIKIRLGEVLPIKIKGAKKIKYPSSMPAFIYEDSKSKFVTAYAVRSVSDGLRNEHILKVDGKSFKIKVKTVSPKYKLCKSYKNKSFKSKYTWKSVMSGSLYVDTSIVPESILKKDAKSYGIEYYTYQRGPEGRSKYCKWYYDPKDHKRKFEVQGIEVDYPTPNFRWATASYLKEYANSIDKIIDTYHIPCAEDMTKEQCCKWIRRNGKALRTLFGLGKSLSGVDTRYLYMSLTGIFYKASVYELSDKYTPNSLVFYHAYNSKKNLVLYQWVKFVTESRLVSVENEEEGYKIRGYKIPTWVGEIYDGMSKYNTGKTKFLDTMWLLL